MTTFVFEFKDQMLELEAKPQPRIGTPGGTCKGCVFHRPDWCQTDPVRRSSHEDCITHKLIFAAADKATEEKLTVLQIAKRLKQ